MAMTRDCKSLALRASLVRVQPPAPTPYGAAIAQLVERIHGKDEVTGSSPVRGSIFYCFML